MQIEPLLTIKEIMAIFRVSQPTIYRWLVEARAKRSQFPLPIKGQKKQKLLWSRESIESFQNASSPAHEPKIESASQRKKRHNAAMGNLKKNGVKTKQSSG